MTRLTLVIGTALAVTSAWALAQEGPESLLPDTYSRPAPKASPSRAPAPAEAASSTGAATSGATVQALPGGDSATAARPAAAPVSSVKLPPLEVLEKMTPEELDEALKLKPRSDIPAAARRSMKQVGVLAADEGGLPAGSLGAQNASLVRAALAGNKGALVSRWGHILLRRALASRLDAPAAMNPADFAGLRAALLVRMGEGEAARALVQDVDTGNFTPGLTQAALDAYVATADITGICPAVALQGGARKDPQWQVARSICTAFQGDGAAGMAQLDRQFYFGVMPRIDMLLAQKYAGAAGKSRRAVKIEWDEVKDMTPWRYALTIGVGLEPPASLMKDAGPRYAFTAATAPMLGLEARAAAADRAAAAGVLSSAAMVDLYSQIYADELITGDWSDRAGRLRDAYVGDPAARLSAMRQLWNGTSDADQRYARQVLTAYAAARLPAEESLLGDAADIMSAIFAAGLDRNALRWASILPVGSREWGMLMVGAPALSDKVDLSSLGKFAENDDSDGQRRTALFIAGLAGLDRVTPQSVGGLAEDLALGFDRRTRWSNLIDRAAAVDNQTLVVLLAGLGMQGASWHKMTPMHLFHIVSGLRKVGLEAEARMIAAEAVART